MRLALAGLALGSLALAPAALAQAAEDGGHAEETFDPVHHSSDGYYLDFEPFARVELPRLFLVRRADGGLGFDAFGSTAAALRSGRYVAEAEHGGEQAEHGADAAQPTGQELEGAVAEGLAGEGAHAPVAAGSSVEGLIASHAHLDAHVVPAGGALLVDFSLTRHLVFALLGTLLMALFVLRMAARYAKGVGRTSAPKGAAQNAFEALVLFVRDDIARPNIGEKADRFVPYLLTAFFFILACNLLGLVPWGATATANISVTAVLAVMTFLMTQLFASKDHWKHVFWPPGVPAFVKPILIPVELLGLFTKPFALAIRLFANMTAGHLVILSLIGLIFTFSKLFGAVAGWAVSPVSVAFALFIYVLELLVAFLQAYVFTMLSAIFIGMAVAEHSHDHAHEHEPGLRHDHHHAAGDISQRTNGEMALTA